MFLVAPQGPDARRQQPDLLYGYGGFNVVGHADVQRRAARDARAGRRLASANLRGGGEYGEDWHQPGMKLQKQNVFDDFIAAAEWLIANEYTSPAEARDPGRIERRAARRRGDESAAGAVPGRRSRRSA